MASAESQVLNDLYKGWIATQTANPDLPLDKLRALFEHWGDVTGEPGDVDYIEVDAGGVPALWAIPKGASADHVIQAMHGGGYVIGSRYSHRKLFAHIARATGVRALIIDYRRAPEHLHPAPVEDSVTTYRWLLDQGYRPENIGLTGDSAGGAPRGDDLAVVRANAEFCCRRQARRCRLGRTCSRRVIRMQPTRSAIIWSSDFRQPSSRPSILATMAIRPQDGTRSPVRSTPTSADCRLFYIQVGGDEALLDDASRLAEAARAAGVNVKYEVWPQQQHVFQFLAGAAPEADDAVTKLAAWFRSHFGLNAEVA